MTYTLLPCVIHSVYLEPAGGSVAVCVHDNIVITCTVSSSPSLWWTLTDLQNASIFEQESYSSSSSQQQEKMLGVFVLRLKSISPLVSTATLNYTDPKRNGTQLTCTKEDYFSDSLPEEFAAITIHVEGTCKNKLCELYNVLQLHRYGSRLDS